MAGIICTCGHCPVVGKSTGPRLNVIFAHTAAPLLAGTKTVTRRNWPSDYAALFTPGSVHTAYDKSPRHGGKPIAFVKTVSVRREALALLTNSAAYGKAEMALEGMADIAPADYVAAYRKMHRLPDNVVTCYRFAFTLADCPACGGGGYLQGGDNCCDTCSPLVKAKGGGHA